MAYGVEFSDAIESLIGGMSQAVDPQLLQKYEYAFGLNVTDRKGLPKTRPGFTKLAVALATGKFQGSAAYRLNNDNRIVYVISGIVYQLKLSDLSIITYTSTLSATVDRCYFCQADRYMIIQDGDPSISWDNANWPVILDTDTEYDQSALRASNPEQALPKGADMAYGHGRLFVATNYIYEAGWSSNLGRVGFVAGDVIKAYKPEDLLLFTENTYLNEGGRVILPEELGYINGMGFQRNVMTGVGLGPLIVGAERGFASFQVNAPRSQWLDIDFGIITYSGEGVGCYSPHSFANNTSDILYRSKDGIRTLRQSATKGESGGLVNDPISNEVEDILSLDDISTLNLSEVAVIDDRVFTTAVPNSTSDAHQALISLDLKPVGSIKGNQSPIYDGVWTGFDFLSLTEARQDDEQRLYAFVRKSATETDLVYLDDSAYQDNASDAPLCRVLTGYKTFDAPFNIKKFKYIELWLSNIKGTVTLTSYYRTDNYPYFNKTTSSIIKGNVLGANQRRSRLRLTSLTVDDDPSINGRLDVGEVFQFCIEWKGFCKIDKVRFVAENTETFDFYIIDEETESVAVAASADAIELDNYEYKVVL